MVPRADPPDHEKGFCLLTFELGAIRKSRRAGIYRKFGNWCDRAREKFEIVIAIDRSRKF